jgi:hypothetical protein
MFRNGRAVRDGGAVRDGRGDGIDDTGSWYDPQPLEVSNAYRRLVGHVIVTVVLATLVIAEAWLFISPAVPHTNPA